MAKFVKVGEDRFNLDAIMRTQTTPGGGMMVSLSDGECVVLSQDRAEELLRHIDEGSFDDLKFSPTFI